jgi:lipoprotein-anchoring transpeptidase ErfK/SrfK
MVGRLIGLAALCAATAWMGSAAAQTYLPPPSQPYPANSRGPAQYTAPAPDFDNLDDDAIPPAAVPQDGRTATIPSPGPILSPDDPRYARAVPQGMPPQGPILSPNDPRYGQPPGPPNVIYSDRAPAATSQGAPAYDGDLRPPQGVGEQASADPRAPAEQTPGAAGEGRTSVMSILPPEDQPETGNPVQLPDRLRRQEVNFVTKEPAGTIVVDTPNTYLYYVLGNGRAIRYGVRVGREGFTWAGVQKITRKAEWPDWHPPPEMIERQPYLPRFMAGGDGNPLGARAMYLGSTTYRIHGTNQPSTIGKFVSSGCVGMLNEDVSDLFERVKVGTRVMVLPQTQPVTASAAPAQGAAGPYSPAPQAGPLPPQAGPSASATPMYRGDGRSDATAVQPLPPPTTIR